MLRNGVAVEDEEAATRPFVTLFWGLLCYFRRRKSDVPSPRLAWETCVRRILFALLALTTSAHAQSVVFTYDQWERLSAGLKEIYVSGAIDAVSTITVPSGASTAKYYNDCIVK